MMTHQPAWVEHSPTAVCKHDTWVKIGSRGVNPINTFNRNRDKELKAAVEIRPFVVPPYIREEGGASAVRRSFILRAYSSRPTKYLNPEYISN